MLKQLFETFNIRCGPKSKWMVQLVASQLLRDHSDNCHSIKNMTEQTTRCTELNKQLSVACSTPSTNLIWCTVTKTLPLFTNAALSGGDQMERKTRRCK